MTDEPREFFGLADGTRVEVLAGRATPEELTAVVVALDEARRADRARHSTTRIPAWRRAARREAVGGGPLASRADLWSIG